MSPEINVRQIATPFRTAFRHAAAERTAAQSIWVEVSKGRSTGMGEGCPREYVTGESIESALDFVASVSTEIGRIDDVGRLRAWVEDNRVRIDKAPAAWCALELAMLDYLARCKNVSVEALLGLPPLPAQFRYTAVLGDSGDAVFAAQLQQYEALGFRDFKLKASGDAKRDGERIQAVHALPGVRLRLDANNLWKNVEALAEWQAVTNAQMFAVEEPLATRDMDLLRAAGEVLRAPVILDENFLRIEQLQVLRDEPARWIVNIRVSKMGGLIRSLDVVNAAREAGIRIVVGAQVGETSVLTRAALPVALAASEMLLAQEGAFGELLLERDLVEPVLQFGSQGVLKPKKVALHPGWGLEKRHEPPS